MHPPLKIGIVGFGRIGAEHARWLSSSPLLRVHGITDATPARRDLARVSGFSVQHDPRVLIEDPALDALLISVPTSMHFDLAKQALEAGKHVMIEKPMTLHADEALALIAVATHQRRVLSVFHNRRWDVDFLTLRTLLASGAVGRVFNIESRLGQWSSCVGPAAREYRPGWRNEAAYGGGGLNDWGSHFIDQMLQINLPAKVTRVYAQLQGNVWSTDCDDFARVLMDFDNGVSAFVEINTTTLDPLPRWRVDGTAGSISSPSSLAFDTREWATFTIRRPDGTTTQAGTLTQGLTEVEIWEQFARATQSDAPPAVRAESVIPTMLVLDAARTSAREGRAVTIS